MSYVYFLHFKQSCNGIVSEHTRFVELATEIKYMSDIRDIQNWAATVYGWNTPILIDWKLLAGVNRPQPLTITPLEPI